MERFILKRLLDWKSIPSQLARENKKFIYKVVKEGALTENFVLQTLIMQFQVFPRHWTQSNPPYEVDFLIQRENDIFPVEVKSELDDDVLNIPLFMADQADRLIGLALEQRNGTQ